MSHLDSLEVKALALKKQCEAANAECQKVRDEIFGELKAQGVDSFKGGVGTVYLTKRFQVKFPANPDVKDELKTYLMGRNAFDALWSINYQSLNSWFKTEQENATAEGRYLDIPGLEPKLDESLAFRRNGK